MRLSLRRGLVVGGTISLATGFAQLSACAVGENGSSTDAGADDVVFHPRPADTSSADGSIASSCTVTPCVVAIAVGGTHSCALIQDGTMRCWGDNYAGEIGGSLDGGADESTTPFAQFVPPVVVSGIAGAVGIAAGGPFLTTLDDDVTCAFSTSGAPQCWGSNANDMLGRGSAPDVAPHPDLSQVSTLTSGAIVTLGQFGACAITSGALACWGQGADNQLGASDGGFGSSTPVPIALPSGKKAVEVALGYAHVCAVLDDQTLACWGFDYYGQCGMTATSGNNISAPTVVPGLSGVAHVALGSYHTCALTSAGAVACFGYNDEGLLGTGSNDGGFIQPTPLNVSLPTGRKATQIVAGTYTTCALLDDGTVACWGYNTNGQVGIAADGSVAVINSPTLVDGVATVDELAMGSGSEHVCARLHSGAVKCWGSNQYGQLGAATDSGALTMSATPVDVAF